MNVFITHIVQIKLAEFLYALLLQIALYNPHSSDKTDIYHIFYFYFLQLYNPHSSDKTLYNQLKGGVLPNFITHIVQIKLVVVLAAAVLPSDFITHIVQIKH